MSHPVLKHGVFLYLYIANFLGDIIVSTGNNEKKTEDMDNIIKY